MNKIYVHGRFVRNPETATLPSGATVCNFAVASDRAFKNAAGERETDFFDVQAWGKLGEVIQSHFNKGKEIVVWGEMQSRKYEDKDGNKRMAWRVRADSIEFCGPKQDSSANTEPAIPPNIDDDALPF